MDGLNSRMERKRKQSVNWKNKQQKLPSLNNREKTNEWNLRDLRNDNQKTYICVVAVLEGQDKEGGGEKVLKKNTMAENLPSLATDINL